MNEEQGSQAFAVADNAVVTNEVAAPEAHAPAQPPKLILAAVAGAVSAGVGAAIWAAVTVATKYQIGWMAVGVGFLVGLAVRKAANGGSQQCAVIAAAFALFGCALGNLLSACGFLAQQESVGFVDVLTHLNPDIAIRLMQATFSPMDVLFYGIAVYEAFKLSRNP
jgi:hypothetical protein